MSSDTTFVVGGTKVRGGQSNLDPPEGPIPIVELKNNSKGFKYISNNDGSRRTWTDVDLNVCYREGFPPRNIEHWPILALPREVYANAIDAAFEGNHHKWRDNSPTVKVTNTLVPLAGFTALNGGLAASWTISIDKVKENLKYIQQHKDIAMLPPKYIEVVPPKVKKVKKQKAKESSRKRRRDDDDEDDYDVDEERDGDDGMDDDDSDNEEREGDEDNDEEKPDAGAWDEDDCDDETCFYRVALYIRSFSLLPLEAWVNAFSSKNNVSSDVLR